MIVAALAIGATAWAAKDPVVMVVNGVDVPRSEFEYLYRKNNQQQLGSQSLDDYVEMFKNYKLKVADALAEGIDTTASYKYEFKSYRNELVAPYLTDSVYLKQLAREAYDRSNEEIDVWHIMTLKGRGDVNRAKARQKIDSIAVLLKNGADYGEVARELSEDRSAEQNDGHLGYMTSMLYPYSFETAAYSLKPGEVSGVVESPVGFHIIKRGESRPARGKVMARHIMKMVKSGTDDSVQKAQIDSIYNVLTSENFADMAREKSDDKGSARDGGNLPVFGVGQMVPEFDEVAFSLQPGEISKPFRSMFGWHIVQTLEKYPHESYEEMEPMIIKRITSKGDERSKMIADHQASLFAKRYKGKQDGKLTAQMRADAVSMGLDSAFTDKYTSAKFNDKPVYTFAGQKITAGDVARKLAKGVRPANEERGQVFDTRLADMINDRLMEYGDEHLVDDHADLRNLINEYRDGMLLFEVSNRKVWEKAGKDKDGLAKYFAEHRGDYTWQKPKVKGWLVQAANDSVANAVRERMKELGADTLSVTIRKEFPKTVQIDRVLVEEGQNPMVDNIIFGKDPVKPKNAAYTTYFMYGAKILEAPEEAADVRGLVTSDYQNQLESEWIEELRLKYPVAVNRKELDKIKD